MVARQYRLISTGGISPLPISAIIQMANLFGCDIYIEAGRKRFNVKCYDELQCGIQPQKEYMVFYFDGSDEDEADAKFRHMFSAAW